MARLAIVFGVLLGILGGVLFGVSDKPVSEKLTSLIPTYFGIGLVVLGLIALSEKARMHAMHLAALVGLAGFAVPLYRVIKAQAAGSEWTLATTGQGIMAALCGIFLALCVKSFIDARRRRKEQANA